MDLIQENQKFEKLIEVPVIENLSDDQKKLLEEEEKKKVADKLKNKTDK